MTWVEAILKEAEGLSEVEQSELIRVLVSRAPSEEADCEDSSVAQRGLASWTESTRGEDWSGFFPESLRNGGGRAP